VICFSRNKPVEVKVRKTGERLDVELNNLNMKVKDIIEGL
jgi:hypothetical protein